MAEKAEKPEGAKPAEFFLGVLDFFSILLPGMIAVCLGLWQWGKAALKPETPFLAAIGVAGYVVGHLLNALSSVFDPLVFDKLYRPEDDPPTQCPLLQAGAASWWINLRHENHGLYSHAKAALRGVPGGGRKGMPGVYQQARAWLRVHSSEAMNELLRYEADSKLFRSLVLVLLMLLAVGWQAMAKQPVWILAMTIGAVPLSLWRYCDLRQKGIRACYLYFLQLHEEDEGARITSNGGPGTQP